MICPSHFSRFDQRNTIGEYRSLSSSFCRFLHSPVTSSLLGPNILLSTLFSNTLSLRSSLNVSDEVSHPYKTTDKIIFPYILIFVFLESNLYHANFLATSVSEPDLFRLPKFHVPNPKSLFHCLDSTKGSVQPEAHVSVS